MKELKMHGLLPANYAKKNSASSGDKLISTTNQIESHLQSCMDATVKDMVKLNENFNYFAMSLKKFFILMSTSYPHLLEFICHNFVHQWVNKS